jgi:hypothetical protein
MLVRLKVLTGALALDEFTVGALADHACVKEQSVRTVLDRQQHLFEEVRREKTGRPGGSTIVYRLKADRIPELEREIDEIYGGLPPKHRDDETESAMLALDVADEYLVRHFQESRDIEKREEILAIANRQIEAVRNEIPAASPESIEKINQRIATLDATRKTCVELVESQKSIHALREKFRVQTENALAVVREASPAPEPSVSAALHASSGRAPAKRPPMPVAASEYGSAFGRMMANRNVMLVHGHEMGDLVDTVRKISDRANFNLVDIELESSLHITKPEIERVSKNAKGLVELIFAVDTARDHSWYSILPQLRRFVGMLTAFVVLDFGYDAKLRNQVFGWRGLYAGDAKQLDDVALGEVVRKPMLAPIVGGLIEADGAISKVTGGGSTSRGSVISG